MKYIVTMLLLSLSPACSSDAQSDHDGGVRPDAGTIYDADIKTPDRDADIDPGLCGGDCADITYSACSCGSDDPCSWADDGFCDDECEPFTPNFDDSADCAPPLPPNNITFTVYETQAEIVEVTHVGVSSDYVFCSFDEATNELFVKVHTDTPFRTLTIETPMVHSDDNTFYSYMNTATRFDYETLTRTYGIEPGTEPNIGIIGWYKADGSDFDIQLNSFDAFELYDSTSSEIASVYASSDQGLNCNDNF